VSARFLIRTNDRPPIAQKNKKCYPEKRSHFMKKAVRSRRIAIALSLQLILLLFASPAFAGVMCDFGPTQNGSGCFASQADCEGTYGSTCNCDTSSNCTPGSTPIVPATGTAGVGSQFAEPTTSATPTTPAPSGTVAPLLSIPIPNLQFSTVVVQNSTGGQQTLDVPWLAQYISAVYQYAVAVAVVLAIVMMMVGGFQYLTSGGDKARVDAGKKRILDAVIGMLLCFGAYIVLVVINPSLVTFSTLQVQQVKGVPWPSNETPPSEVVPGSTDVTAAPSAAPTGGGFVPAVPVTSQGYYVDQFPGTTFGSIPYNPAGSNCTNFNIHTSGCGIASAAMVISAWLGTPPTAQFVTNLANLSINNGFRPCGNGPFNGPNCVDTCSGTAGGFFTSTKTVGTFGLTGTDLGTSWSAITAALQMGHPLVALMHKSIFTGSGHFIVLASISSDGSTIQVIDPGRNPAAPYTCDHSVQPVPSGANCADAGVLNPTVNQNAVPIIYIQGGLADAYDIHK
jgi:hypothetical protein